LSFEVEWTTRDISLQKLVHFFLEASEHAFMIICSKADQKIEVVLFKKISVDKKHSCLSEAMKLSVKVLMKGRFFQL